MSPTAVFAQIKDVPFTEKMRWLAPYHRELLDSVKKELKQEHLATDRAAHKKLFGNKPVHRISLDELVGAYSPMLTHFEELGEFIASRWIFKHAEIYEYFSEQLESSVGEFEHLHQLDAALARELVDGALALFSAREVFCFCVLNSVVLPPEEFLLLEQRAKEGGAPQPVSSNEEPETQKLWRSEEVERLEQRYLKRIAGLERKFHSEVAQLKRQIAALSRKVQGDAAPL